MLGIYMKCKWSHTSRQILRTHRDMQNILRALADGTNDRRGEAGRPGRTSRPRGEEDETDKKLGGGAERTERTTRGRGSGTSDRPVRQAGPGGRRTGRITGRREDGMNIRKQGGGNERPRGGGREEGRNGRRGERGRDERPRGKEDARDEQLGRAARRTSRDERLGGQPEASKLGARAERTTGVGEQTTA